MSKETGGPAFPYEYDHLNNDGSWSRYFEQGQTLRDHFAGLALQGWLSSYGPDMPHPAQNGSDIDDAARNAYKLADAMLRARGE